MNYNEFIGPVAVGAGGYIAGLPSVSNALNGFASKLPYGNTTLGILLVLAGGVIKAYAQNQVGDVVGYLLAGMGAGELFVAASNSSTSSSSSSSSSTTTVTASPYAGGI